jgi:hypothetical protein
MKGLTRTRHSPSGDINRGKIRTQGSRQKRGTHQLGGGEEGGELVRTREEREKVRGNHLLKDTKGGGSELENKSKLEHPLPKAKKDRQIRRQKRCEH